MRKLKNIILKQFSSEEINNQNIRRIILKVVVGFGVVAAIFFIAINITHKKLSQLSETMSTILDPNIKLIKLKEISTCLYNAEANVKAFTIRRDTAYLLNYENDIYYLNTRLDTLSILSNKGGIVDTNEAKANLIFSLHIDTLRELIVIRIDLFCEYIELKTGDGSPDVLKQLLKKIKSKKNNAIQKPETPKKSFLSQLFVSKQNKSYIQDITLPEITLDSVQKNIREIITKTQQEEKIKESRQLSEEIDITQREYLAMSRIISLLNNMEQKVLDEGVKRIHATTDETTLKIRFISMWLTAFGLLLALVFLYFIYRDIIRSKRFKEQLLLIKRNAEKLASQYSLSLIEASLDPLFTISPEGKITDMNQATVKVTGVSRKNLIDTDFYLYFTEPDKAQKGYQQVFAKGFVADYPLTIKDGKLTDVLFNGSVYKDDKGNVIGAVVVARDITEQKRFEKELIDSKSKAERAMEKAEESTRLKEAFLANMSHEIRTPMNAIMGFSDILSRRKLGEQEKEYVAIIKSAGENLLTIINDILDISKIEAGMMSFEVKNFSVKEIFKSLNEMLMVKAKEKKLELIFNCDSKVPDCLLGDPTRLSQIIINLAGNAIKFTETGRINVTAHILETENEKIIIEFSVEDTGIGIPQNKLGYIFERFSQAASKTTRKYGGTGLGLSIAKQLVELQGGDLTVISELKVGSIFTFFIPYKKSTAKPLTAETVEKTYNMEELGKLNILLAEDNKLNVLLISSLFSEHNFKLQVVENGSTCIDKLKENNGLTPLTKTFDIVLMDMEMPVMNGYEATTIIRKDLKNNIPIIAMTAHAMEGEREKCLDLGMNDYISKPINANLLFEKIYNLTFNTK